MTLALPATKTYATMLAELRSRCKLHATVGAAPALESILAEANEFVYSELDTGKPWQSTLTLAANTSEYEFETDDSVPIARGSVHAIWIEQGSSERVPLPQGISHAHRADAALRAIPERWDTKYIDDDWMLEVWPTPDASYVLYIDHNRVLTRFASGTDKPSAPPRLVLQYAIAMGKAHYGHADAETAGQAFKRSLTIEKSKAHENRRYLSPRQSVDPTGPRVMSRADGTFVQVGTWPV